MTANETDHRHTRSGRLVDEVMGLKKSARLPVSHSRRCVDKLGWRGAGSRTLVAEASWYSVARVESTAQAMRRAIQSLTIARVNLPIVFPAYKFGKISANEIGVSL